MVVILLALAVCCVSTGCYSAGSGGLLSAMVVVLLALTVCCVSNGCCSAGSGGLLC